MKTLYDQARTIRIPVWSVNGEPLLGCEGIALLLGRTVEEIRAHAIEGDFEVLKRLPADWIRAGRRRARESMASTGSSDIRQSLAYWALLEHGCDVEFLYQGVAQ